MSVASLERAVPVAPERRVLALVLPELLCELAEKRLLWGLQLRGPSGRDHRALGVR